MKMEPVRIVITQDGHCGVIVNAATESFIRALSKIFALDLEVRQGWLIKSASVLGFDHVLLDDGCYPVYVDSDGLTLVDLSRRVSLASNLDGGGLHVV